MIHRPSLTTNIPSYSKILHG